MYKFRFRVGNQIVITFQLQILVGVKEIVEFMVSD